MLFPDLESRGLYVGLANIFSDQTISSFQDFPGKQGIKTIQM
jgi:hypothetical protein